MKFPRVFRIALVLLPLAGVSCSDGQPPAASSQTSANVAAGQFDDMAGHWAGSAKVIVQWAKQKDLPVDLVIEPDGRVSGTVGDAKLIDGWLRAQRVGAPLRVHGKLDGNLIDAEAIRRDAIDVLLHPGPDGTLTGGLHSSGWEIGGKGSMKLSASDLTLRRVDDHAQGSPATAPGPQ